MSDRTLPADMLDLFDDEAELLHLLLEADADAAAIRPRAATGASDELPLAFAQQRLWFIHQLEPDTTAFNNLIAVRLTGRLNLAALERSLGAIVQRHEVLRTTFTVRQGRPTQVIAPTATLTLPIVYLQQMDADTQAQEIRRLALETFQQPFDLSRDLFLRPMLLQLGMDEHVLLIILHHIIWDAWSAKIFYQELDILYGAYAAGKHSPLPNLSIQYADFAVWQRAQLNQGTLEAELAFWKQQLQGAPPVLTLPTDRPRPASQTFRGAHQTLAVSPADAVALNTLSQQQNCTLFMTMLAAFQTLLMLYSGQKDIVVGTDVSDRSRVETEALMGFFVNQLALRTNLAGNPTFRELLSRVRQVTLDAYAHRDVPFEQLVQALRLERRLEYPPVFQVKIFLLHGEEEALRLPGITAVPLDIDSEIARLDLVLIMRQANDRLYGWLNYNTDLFNAATIAQMADQLIRLLSLIAADPETRLDALGEALAQTTKERKAMERQKRETSGFRKFKQIERRTVVLPETAMVTIEAMDSPVMPIPVIQPATDAVDLADWARNNLEQIEADVLRHGAVLFRGFQVNTPATFENFALVICHEIYKENSEHTPVSNNGNVQTPVFYPQYKKLLWHNENTFNASWPMKIMFGCVQPAQQGGETPLVDSRKVYERIPAEIREQFQHKKIMYVRNYGDGLGLDWQTVFRTTDKAEVEAQCRQAAIEFEWRDGDRLRTRAIRPALGPHPRTGEMVWFNQAQHWHVSCLDETTRESLTSIFEEEDLPRHCYYGDGSPIADSIMDDICQVYQDLELSFPWQMGDVMLIDNLLAAHGRNPFEGPRKILVAMGEMMSHEDIQA